MLNLGKNTRNNGLRPKQGGRWARLYCIAWDTLLLFLRLAGLLYLLWPILSFL